jgi:hypothetical protein
MTDGQGTVSAAAAILYMVVAFLVGGGSVLATITLLSRQILKSPVLIKFLEHLANSASPELLQAVNSTAELVDEVTDEIPYDTKPQLTPAIGTPRDFTPDNDVQSRLSNFEGSRYTGMGFRHG